MHTEILESGADQMRFQEFGLTCRKLTVSRMRLYELIPPVNTSLRSRCSRNCFSTSTRKGRFGCCCMNSCKANKHK